MKVRHLVFAVVLLASVSHLGKAADEAQRLESVKRLFQQQRWEEILREAQGTVDQSADFDYYVGMALSRLERWNEARVAFSQGAKKAPRDVRFLVERAGAEYKLSDFRTAKCDLRQALRLDAQDPYVAEFLGTIYLLEANLEAALKYWNHVEKPRLTAVEAVPSPKTEKRLFDRAITFSPPGVLERKSFLRTNALLENLDVFSAMANGALSGSGRGKRRRLQSDDSLE